MREEWENGVEGTLEGEKIKHNKTFDSGQTYRKTPFRQIKLVVKNTKFDKRPFYKCRYGLLMFSSTTISVFRCSKEIIRKKIAAFLKNCK